VRKKQNHKHPSLANMLVNEKKLTSNLVIKQHDIRNVAKVFPMKPLLPSSPSIHVAIKLID
jgi:hypothetical protein